ncbi:MAG: hypothetical protein Edafosvirus10_20 [Edafosvirus sp.]|uniref:Uncharacterized protein n=1 Tax=Edafosvirus sp. TaxID=2487765 RepID=A0A3G4ZTX0_9VIRU|nr:MAG: hypothetical protein Edafosvirus10_20 [Edafosvirus sp.]
MGIDYSKNPLVEKISEQSEGYLLKLIKNDSIVEKISEQSEDYLLKLIKNDSIEEDLNYQTPLGNTALMLAVSRLYYTLAIKLIEKECDVNLTNNNGDTALSIALVQSSHERKLTRFTGNEYSHDRTLNDTLVFKLLEKTTNINNINNSNGLTPLAYCLLHRLEDFAIELIKKNCKLDIVIASGPSFPISLFLFACANQMDCVANVIIEKCINDHNLNLINISIDKGDDDKIDWRTNMSLWFMKTQANSIINDYFKNNKNQLLLARSVYIKKFMSILNDQDNTLAYSFNNLGEIKLCELFAEYCI